MSTGEPHNLNDRDGQPLDRSDIDEIQAILGDRYHLQWIIGRGGMSTVWLAKDTQAVHPGGHDVAIKILRPEYTENDEFRTRFRNESEASKHLDNPNVVATYDHGETQLGEPGYRTTSFCYIVMEYVQGEALVDVLAREGTLPESLVAELVAQAANGLEEIHSSGLVHRDIKPGNILITADGITKITDFGIAKAAEAVPLTRTGMVVGTAQYVSPEQAQGKNVEPASDIYSLGVVAYECLAGHRPFTGDSSVSVAIKHIREDPAPLPPNISPQMREFIAICLRKDPAARYANGTEMAAAIAMVAQGQRPPQPHHVPNVADHPLTEQLGSVATGQGTAVPPVQGPRHPQAAGASSAGAGAHQPGSRTAQRVGGPAGASDKKKNRTPLIILSVVAIAALLGIAFMALSNRESPEPAPETFTVTSEVPTPPTEETVTEEPETATSTVVVTEESEPEQPSDREPSTRPQRPQRTNQPERAPQPNQPRPEQPNQSAPPAQPTGNNNPAPPAPDGIPDVEAEANPVSTNPTHSPNN